MRSWGRFRRDGSCPMDRLHGRSARRVWRGRSAGPCGVAKNGAVRRGLEECLNVSIAYDPRCQHFGAIGAALWAYRQASKA